MARRRNTGGLHIVRMSQVSTLLARSMGWSENRCELMLHASPMHDIGKIGIADAILLKPGRLTPQKFEVMKTHASIGADMLSGDDSELLKLAHTIALSHHEKRNGSGYPAGLAGEAIPLAGRIVAVADVFDALTSNRPYKKAWPVQDAVAFVRKKVPARTLTPTWWRISYSDLRKFSLSPSFMPMRCKCLCELGIFDLLANLETSMSSGEIAGPVYPD